MLKITTKTDLANTIFELEGKLTGDWVNEFELCWREIPAGGFVTVSLKSVSFIDDEGKKLLARLYESGAEILAEGCMTKGIVQEIIGENRQRQFHPKNSGQK